MNQISTPTKFLNSKRAPPFRMRLLNEHPERSFEKIRDIEFLVCLHFYAESSLIPKKSKVKPT